MMNVVEIEGVSQRYGRATVLHDLNLSLAPGEVLGLFGHNGAGKTTAMKLVLGLLRASAGEVRVFGRAPSDPHAPLARLPAGKRHVLCTVERRRNPASLRPAQGRADASGRQPAGRRRPDRGGRAAGQDLFQGHAPAPRVGPGLARRAAPVAARRTYRGPRPVRHPGLISPARPPACGRHQHHPVLPRAAGRRGAHQPCGDPDPGPPAGLGQPGAVARRGRLADADPHLRLAARRIAATTLERRRPCHPALGRRRAASGGAQRQQSATAAPTAGRGQPQRRGNPAAVPEDIYRHYMDSAMVTAQEAAL